MSILSAHDVRLEDISDLVGHSSTSFTETVYLSRVINDESMALEIDGRVIATAEFREHAAADGHGAWIVSCHPGRLFTRNQAITAMVLAERLAAGYGDDDPFVLGWREELGL